MLRLGPSAPSNLGYDYHGDHDQHILGGRGSLGGCSAADAVAGTSHQQSAVEHTQRPITTGSTVCGVRYKDGVMIMTDTAVWYGSSLRYKDVERLKKVGRHSVVAASGEHADFQMLCKKIDTLAVRDWVNEDGCFHDTAALRAWLTNRMYHYRSKVDPLWNQYLIGGITDDKKFYLGYVDLFGTSFSDQYAATGLGSYLAIPILRAKHHENLTEQEAKELLESCFRTLFYRDCNGYNRVQCATVRENETIIHPPYRITHDWSCGLWQIPTMQLKVGSSW